MNLSILHFVYAVETACLFWLVFITYLIIRRDTTPPPIVNSKKVAIIVPVFNDGALITDALTSIANQITTSIIEVIIVNDCSTDDTDEKINLWLNSQTSGLKVTYTKTSKNMGRKVFPLRLAYNYVSKDTDAVIVLDGDTYMAPDCLQLLVNKLYSKKNLAGVCGMILTRDTGNLNFIQKLQAAEHRVGFAHFKYAMGTIDAVLVLSGALSIHSKEALDRYGIWDKEWLVEDITWSALALNRGSGIEFEPKALGWTDCPDTLTKLCNQRRRWSRGRIESLIVCVKDKLTMTLVGRIMTYIDILIIPFTYYYLLKLDSYLIATGIAFLVLGAAGNVIVNHRTGTSVPPLQLAKDLLFSKVVGLITLISSYAGLIDESIGRHKAWLTR